MRLIATALIAMTCLAAGALNSAHAQTGVSVGFKNQTNKNVIVQGFTVVNGVTRRGSPFLIAQNGMAFESNVPPGLRSYTILDANQTARFLLRDQRVPIQNRDTFFSIMTSPVNPQQVILAPADSLP